MGIFHQVLINFFIVVAVLLTSCNVTPFFSSYSNTRGKVEKASANSDEQPADCLLVRSGTDLTVDQKRVYGNVGMLALVDAQGKVEGICSGMLIRPDVVITAQHCVANTAQVPYLPSQLIYTLDPANAAVGRKVKAVIQWAEKTNPISKYRDVALVTLEKPFDESFPLYDLRQTVAESVAGITDLQMVGFGGYTNGADVNSYSIGMRRFGTAKFNNYTNVDFPDYTNTNYSVNADYLSLLPGTSGQIICAGDSGSSLFWDSGSTRSIVGITSLGSSSGTTPGQQCASAGEGLFVPSHQVRSWVSARLAEIKAGDKLETYTAMQGTIKSVTATATGSTIVLNETKYLDNPLGLTGAEISAALCKNDCLPLGEVTGALSVGGKVHLQVSKTGDQIQIRKIGPINIPAVFSVQFDAMLEDVPVADSELYGRKEKKLVFSKVKTSEGANAVPLVADKALGIYCTEGCSANSAIKTVGFALAKDKGVTVKGEVIEGYGLYIREISANASLNAAAPKVDASDKVIDDEDAEDEVDEDDSGC